MNEELMNSHSFTNETKAILKLLHFQNVGNKTF